MNVEQLQKIKEKLMKAEKISFDRINLNEVKDLDNIKISKKKSSRDRILDFLNTVDNPYVFKIDKVLVKIEFSDNGKTAEDCITNVIKSIYK